MITGVRKKLSDSKKDELGLDVLLQLDNEIFPMDCGYWTKIEAKTVTSNEHIPHGIKYSLTLHDSNNVRMLGYDNAHGIKPKRKKYGAKRVVWDHRHERKIVEPYEFENAAQLLEDFWVDVEKILLEEQKG
jgi:hypothetical protein